jgi:hypothetical protein
MIVIWGRRAVDSLIRVVAELGKSWRDRLIVIRGRRAVVPLVKVSLGVLVAGGGSRDGWDLLEIRSTLST